MLNKIADENTLVEKVCNLNKIEPFKHTRDCERIGGKPNEVRNATAHPMRPGVWLPGKIGYNCVYCPLRNKA